MLSTLIHRAFCVGKPELRWSNMIQSNPIHTICFKIHRFTEHLAPAILTCIDPIWSNAMWFNMIHSDPIWSNLIHFNFLYFKGQETLDTSIHRAFRASQLELHFSRTISGSTRIKRWTDSCLRIIERIQMPTFSDHSSPPHGRHPHCYLSRRKTPVRIGWHVCRNSEYHGGRFFEIKVDTVKATSGKDLYQV